MISRSEAEAVQAVAECVAVTRRSQALPEYARPLTQALRHMLVGGGSLKEAMLAQRVQSDVCRRPRHLSPPYCVSGSPKTEAARHESGQLFICVTCSRFTQREKEVLNKHVAGGRARTRAGAATP